MPSQLSAYGFIVSLFLASHEGVLTFWQLVQFSGGTRPPPVASRLGAILRPSLFDLGTEDWAFSGAISLPFLLL